MEFVLTSKISCLRDIPFVTDVSVPTINLVFKPVSLKQFHFLKPLDIFMTLYEIGEKGRLRSGGSKIR